MLNYYRVMLLKGWGCAYRTLQTICSMLKCFNGINVAIPSIKQIQEILVKIGDKENLFINSRDWIGGAETCYVIDELFQIPCYLHHISNSERLSSKKSEIVDYFKNQGGLIAMGGDQDAASKLIAGVNINDDNLSLLIVVSKIFILILKILNVFSGSTFRRSSKRFRRSR